MTNLRQQLAETAAKQTANRTEQLYETLRKSAFERASEGFHSLSYTSDYPVRWGDITSRFKEQGLTVELYPEYNTIKLIWN